MMLRIFLCFVFIGMAGCSPGVGPGSGGGGAQPPNGVDDFFGINMLWPPGDAATLRERFQKVRGLGVQAVRIDWEWRLVEPEQGRYDWTELDRLVKVAHEEGVRLLPIVHYAPDWAVRPEPKADTVYQNAPREDAFLDFARFLRASIERYGPEGSANFPFTPITHWQVWNEPNLAEFWGPEPDPEAFTQMMIQVSTELVSMRDRIQLVHAGLAKSDLIFMWQLWDLNPYHGDTFDILAVHPYVFDAQDGVRLPSDMDADDPEFAALGFIGSVSDPGYLGKVFNLRLFLELRGVEDTPIWITEMGYFVGDHSLGLSEQKQAQRLHKTLTFIKERLTTEPYGDDLRALPVNVERVFWFSLEDYPSPDGLGTFGLYRPNGSERPAAGVYRDFVQAGR